jgi:hypothetical protein
MEPPLLRAISKLAQAGEHAGFTIKEMILLLEAGLSVPDLIQLIELRIQTREEKLATPPVHPSSHWVM